EISLALSLAFHSVMVEKYCSSVNSVIGSSLELEGGLGAHRDLVFAQDFGEDLDLLARQLQLVRLRLRWLLRRCGSGERCLRQFPSRDSHRGYYRAAAARSDRKRPAFTIGALEQAIGRVGVC